MIKASKDSATLVQKQNWLEPEQDRHDSQTSNIIDCPRLTSTSMSMLSLVPRCSWTSFLQINWTPIAQEWPNKTGSSCTEVSLLLAQTQGPSERILGNGSGEQKGPKSWPDKDEIFLEGSSAAKTLGLKTEIEQPFQVWEESLYIYINYI